MQKFWILLTRDDLIWRIYYSLYGAIVAAGGLLLLWLVVTDGRSWESLWITTLALGFVLVLESWAGALFFASFAPPHWRISRMAPNLAADGCEVAGLVLVILLLVLAVPLTITLRALGVRGY